MRRTLVTLLSALALVATGVVAGFAAGGSGTVAPPPRIAFLANGINPADAVAAGSIAGQLGAPVFTTRPEALEDAARIGLVAYESELIIVLGGPVAIADSVLEEVAAATGLPVLMAGGDDVANAGIVRAAGETRFDTAAVVAELVTTYAPAYLPVGATALGAIDADTAERSDDAALLDGLDSTAFLRAGLVTQVSANDWHPALAGECPRVDGGAAVERRADGDVLPHPNTPEFGTCYQTRVAAPTDHRRGLVLDAVDFCWQGPRATDSLQLVTRTDDGTAKVLVLDETSYDHSAADCVTLTIPVEDRTDTIVTLTAGFGPGATAETRPISIVGLWSSN